MSSFRKMTCEGTLRQVFIRVYRLEIQSVMLVLSTQICELCLSPLLPSSTLPPLPVWISILYPRIQCVRGELWGSGPNTCRKVPLQVNVFIWRHFALSSMNLIILHVTPSAPTPFYRRLLDRYFKTARTGFSPPLIFTACLKPTSLIWPSEKMVLWRRFRP